MIYLFHYFIHFHLLFFNLALIMERISRVFRSEGFRFSDSFLHADGHCFIQTPYQNILKFLTHCFKTRNIKRLIWPIAAMACWPWKLFSKDDF